MIASVDLYRYIKFYLEAVLLGLSLTHQKQQRLCDPVHLIAEHWCAKWTSKPSVYLWCFHLPRYGHKYRSTNSYHCFRVYSFIVEPHTLDLYIYNGAGLPLYPEPLRAFHSEHLALHLYYDRYVGDPALNYQSISNISSVMNFFYLSFR